MTTAALSRRLGAALGAHLCSLSERKTVTDAMVRAETWNDLPLKVRILVQEIESRPGLNG